MSQYNQMLMLYDQLITMADEINDLIKREYFDDILNKMSSREKVFIQIKLAKRCTKLSVAEQANITKLESTLKTKEKANIELLQTNMSIVKSELDKLNLRNKLKKAYNQQDNSHGSIIDIDDSYRPNK